MFMSGFDVIRFSGERDATEMKTESKVEKVKSKQKQIFKPQSEAGQAGISFAQKHRLEKLPAEIERLEAEIAKLEEFLSDPELFQKEPVKFNKASEGLVERKEKLNAAEEEWIELEALREEAEG